jgi:hypothetical protein
MPKRALGIEEIATEVGRLFGTTEAHARRWLDQRKDLVQALSTIRDKAAGLVSELGGDNQFAWRKGRRKKQQGVPVVQPGMRASRKKRVISAQARAKMRAAAKRRWAEIRKKAAKSRSDV